LFERLAADGVVLVLASSSGRDEVDHHIDLLGVRDLIRESTSRDDVERSKPCPDIFEAALGKAGSVSKDEVRVVGDTPWDMKAAARLSLAALGFRCGGFSDADLAGAAALYDGPEDLLRRYHGSDFAR
jgi:phosphoglycolate phosphatase-like HAD superfamily hydrolase